MGSQAPRLPRQWLGSGDGRREPGGSLRKSPLSRWPGLEARLRDQRVHIVLIVALSFLVYANNFHHEYHLDDAYTLLNNPSVRSLEQIPRYFVDPATYTSLREQVDYRPLLQVTYAVNYWMGMYNTLWWHFTQIVLHALVALGIYALCRRMLVLLGDPAPEGIALFAGVVFAIHPAGSGVVNYLNARSSLLTAVFILPALLSYMKPIEDEGYARPAWAAAFFLALALFTKVEAIGVLGAFWAYELWQRARESGPRANLLGDIRRSLDARTFRRMTPALAVTAAYVAIRWTLMAGYETAQARHAADVGPYEYLLTQLTAWWYYIQRWIAPVRLVADYASYPVYRSWSEPVVVLALGGWVLVGALLVAARRRAPWLLFLAIAALALLSPTSSLAPLAEMVNEHRPYLPIGILSLALFIPAGRWLRQGARGAVRTGAIAGLGLVLVSLAALTWRRNEAFSTEARYWQDVLAKAPSARAHVNYGRTRMAADDLEGAVRHFEQALDLAPSWYITHLNLGAVNQRLGRFDRAREHYDRAVDLDRFSGMSHSFRGEFYLSQGQYAAARDDFLEALPVSLERYRNVMGLARSYAGLGDVARSLEYTEHMLELEPQRALYDIPPVSLPYFQSPELHRPGIEYFERLRLRLPGEGWVLENIARLADMAGDSTRAARARREAQELGGAASS